MTLVTGTITDTSGQPLNGVLIATGLEWTTQGDTVVAPEADHIPITNGTVNADLAPGPARLIITVGSHARGIFTVTIPDTGPVTLASLIGAP